MRTIVHEMRGIPYYLLKEYLQELDGTLVGEDLIQGDGWSVKIEKLEPFRLFSLSVGQSRLTMELEERIADDFLERFKKKTFERGAKAKDRSRFG